MQLRFAAADEPRPPAPDAGAPGVQTWRTPDGQLIAQGYWRGSTAWMHWPALAVFRFGGDPFITAYPDAGVSRAIVEDVYRRGVLPMAIQALGREALHASGVLTDAGVIAIAARSHTGKSTFAYALSRRGFPQWADDGVVVQAEAGRVSSVPLPFQVRLRPESSRLFGFDEAVFRQFNPDVVIAGTEMNAVPLAAICLLERSEAVATSDIGVCSRGPSGPPCSEAEVAIVTRMTPSDAFTAVLIHAHEFNPFDSDRRRRMLQAYLDVVDRVPVYKVRFVAGREHLDRVLDTVIDSLRLAAPAAESSWRSVRTWGGALAAPISA